MSILQKIRTFVSEKCLVHHLDEGEKQIYYVLRNH